MLPSKFENDVIGVEAVDSFGGFLYWEDSGVLKVAVGGVVGGGRLPWTATGEEVKQNNAEGLDVIERGEYEPLYVD